MKIKYSFFTLLLFTIVSQAQQLQLEAIMKGDAFVGPQPVNPRWSPDGSKVYFEWNPKNNIETSTYLWKKGMAEPTVIEGEEAAFSHLDFKKKGNSDIVYYTDGGILYSYSIKNKIAKRCYQHSNPIYNLQLGAHEGEVFFQQNDNLFLYNANTASIVQITNFKEGATKEKAAEKDSFLKSQQKELFQFIRDQEEKKKWNEKKEKLVKPKFLKPYFYGKNDLDDLTIDSKGNFVTFRLTENNDQKNEIMEVFITADGYNQSRNTKEKVSVKNFIKTKFGIVDVKKDTVYMIDFSKLSHINDKPKYYDLYETLKNTAHYEKLIVVQAPVFSQNGEYAVTEIRSQDNKDRWIIQLNLDKGTFVEIDYQHDDAWIGGPGISSGSFGSGIIGFLYDNETIYFQSEATGFSHLYTYNLKSKIKKQLTSGNWEVRTITLSNDKKTFYLSTNTTHPGNRDFYRLNYADGVLQPLLTNDGAHEVSLSPDEETLLVRYSYKNKPWELYIGANKNNASLAQITSSTTAEFKAYPWCAPEVITFKAQDGVNVNARVYNPQAAKKNNAAIIFVHGAGYLQNAHHYWSSYFREYMFHNLLTDLGYTVLDIDYRASDGYGRDFRTGIYRFMGGKDLTDQIDGKKYLVNNLGINPGRVGIYGGSYGGFITLMAMLTTPKEFASGAALRSVTDWAHYNHGYTGNILNFPETDPDAYKKSSPIYFADKLEGHLLMLHGVVDDNVEYKDVVRLSQRFIELGKKNWDLAIFPVEAHGFRETYSWVDEYRRILDLFNSTLLQKH